MDKNSGQGPALWNKSSSSTSIRQPKSIVADVSPKIERKTCLNADAPEFVPLWLQAASHAVADIEQQLQNVHISLSDNPPYPKHTVQGRLNRNKQSNQQQGTSCYNQSAVLPNGYYEPSDSMDIIRLKQIISSLIKYPGQFDDLLPVFMETIFPYFSDIMAMSEIAQLIVKQGIDCPNFRYNGARLCWFVEQNCPYFRTELHLKCQKELQENLHQQNVVLFIAELYTQLPHDGLYGALLIESLKKLLGVGGNDNVKCVCQALKLTGFSLEQTQKQSLDELFSHLKTFENTVTGSVLVVLNSVINLREINWGRSAAESKHSESSDYEPDCEDIISNGFLYETDGGHDLTNEEQEFLAANATQDDYIFDNEDPDGLYDPEPEMDDEIRAAFEEFIKLSKG